MASGEHVDRGRRKDTGRLSSLNCIANCRDPRRGERSNPTDNVGRCNGLLTPTSRAHHRRRRCRRRLRLRIFSPDTDRLFVFSPSVFRINESSSLINFRRKSFISQFLTKLPFLSARSSLMSLLVISHSYSEIKIY